ncbi:MAG: GTPase HflX [Treponema sp.]|jgi:GTP-binding protein HflX|nr:GTPase HflX [Treponema sp.]
MGKIYDTREKPKRAFLVGIRGKGIPVEETESQAAELAGLARALGLEIAAQETVLVREKNAKFGMGSGKARELAEAAAGKEADCLVLDWDPSPSQQRNWETLAELPVVDRQELIIRIFAERARTREAELQVRLAELSYSLPRLSHRYIDLSRQRGGRYGTRGAGETQLETDRRQVEKRIHRLEQELAEVKKQRAVRRQGRERRGLPSCALVGYTNAGKSSLLNSLTGAGVYVEDQLFATLDATTRRLDTGDGHPFLITDTVGFIRRLPHSLIDAFRSTLEELCLSDLLIQVLDASDPSVESCHQTTLSVLRELGAGRIPMITVLNKADRFSGGRVPEELLRRFPESVAVSARTRDGLDPLLAEIRRSLSSPVHFTV